MEVAVARRSWASELLIATAFLSTGAVLVAATAAHPFEVALLLVGAVVALLFFSCPILGVWLVLAFTPIEAVGPLSSTQSKAVKLGLTLLAALALLRKRSNAKMMRDPYRWPFAVMLISGLISSVLAQTLMKSLLGFLSVAIFVLYYTTLRRSGMLAEHGDAVLRIVIWSAAALSGLCFVQLTSGYSGPFSAAEHQTVAAEEYFSTVWPGIWRACATFNGPNAAGAFFAIAGVSALIRAIVCKKLRWAYLMAALICFGDVLMTFSRGALLGYFCGLLFACWHVGALSRKRVALLSLVVTVALGTVIFHEPVQKYLRVGLDLEAVSPERIDAWHASRTLLQRNPVFGIGFYEFREASRGIAGLADMPLHPHNGFLKALVEQGPLGACAYLFFLLTFLRKAGQNSGASSSAETRWVLGAIAGAGICLFTQELFDANFTIGGSSVAILFACMLAIQAGTRNQLPIQSSLRAGGS